ncbi:MAG: hypothetical protein ACRBN8_14045 [Nannocystales bacterium]
MKKLSSEARDLLEQYREESDVCDQPDAAVLERIEASIEHGAAAPANARPRAAAWVAWGAVAAASVATLWIWDGRAELQVAAPSPVSTAVDRLLEQAEQSPRRVLAPQPGSPATPSAVLPPAIDSNSPSVPAPQPRGRRAVDEPEAPAKDDELQRELDLLRQAREALRKGRTAGAKASLRAHALSYPQGQLAEEREALLVVVRCAGREAETGRAEFERSHPRSHHLPSIRLACESEKTPGAVTDEGGGGQ